MTIYIKTSDITYNYIIAIDLQYILLPLKLLFWKINYWFTF
jgi:hypothetical protein